MSTTLNTDEVNRFSQQASHWWDETGPFKPLHQLNPCRLKYLLSQIREHFPLKEKNATETLEGLRVVDVGCGGGLVCEPLARLGAQVTGVDASEQTVHIAQHHAQQMDLSINYQVGTVETLVSEHKTYQVVLALEIIEHVDDLVAFLDSCTQLVEPGGLLIISTLNRTVKSYLLAILGAEYILRWVPRGTHTWAKFLRPSEIAMPLEKQGMEVRSICGMTYNPFHNTWELGQDIEVNYFLTAKRNLVT